VIAPAGILRAVRYRAIFFDAGETIVHPQPSFPELFAQVVEREGHPVEPGAVVEASRVVLERFSEAADDRELWTTSPERSKRFWVSVYERMLDVLALPGGVALADRLYATFTDRSNYALFDDVRPALDRLSGDGVVIGLVSNFEAWLEELLADLGVRDAFGVRVISGIEGIEKPDSRIYELALERADVAADESVFVGDNPEFDVIPPAELGMFTVLVDRRNRHVDHEGARIVDLADLPALLEAE
jgi:putative hydrolase of the HAD superfamily